MGNTVVPNHAAVRSIRRRRARAGGARAASVRLLLLALVVAGAGCRAAPRLRPEGPVRLASGERPDFGAFAGLPRWRLGCLPFPGPFTLFETVDPDALGPHRYRPPAGDEIDRGVVYTHRAGYIDLAHVREAADLVAYFAPRLETALHEGWPCIQLRSLEPSVYVVELRNVDELEPPSPAIRTALVRELSIRLAQRLAVQALAWHEIMTWYGYRTIILITEKPSAFTCDDMTSHVLGALVGGAALRRIDDDVRSDDDYDAAAAAVLERMVHELDPEGADGTRAITNDLEAHWWTAAGPTRRHFDLGIDVPLVPWTVGADAPEPLQVPGLDDVLGFDCTGFIHASIEPRVLESGRIRAALPDDPDRIDAERDIPRLIEAIRRAWLDEAGPGADRPCRCTAPESGACPEAAEPTRHP